jgi:hypothetical protein
MSDRGGVLRRAAPLALLAALALGWLLPTVGALRFASSDTIAEDRWTDVLAALPDDALVLVAFDPDAGTYAEIRPAVRTLLSDLLARGAQAAVVNLTPEGRAVFTAERDRLTRAGAASDALVDLGFIPGAEAAIAALARQAADGAATSGPLATVVTDAGRPVDLLAVIGGNDLGPRSWVEQFLPRVGDVRTIAVVPTSLLPEVTPYVASGQLDALLATPRDGARYGQALGSDAPGIGASAEVTIPPAWSILLGMLAAVALLGQQWLARVGHALRSALRDGADRA